MESLLYNHFLRQITPEVFFHPVWVRFSGVQTVWRMGDIHPLRNAANELEAKGDIDGACSLLLVCAAWLSARARFDEALEAIAKTEYLAKHSHFQAILLCAEWAAGAVQVQAGDLTGAIEKLQELQADLRTEGDWVLSDLIETIWQALDDAPQSNYLFLEDFGPSSDGNPILQASIQALLDWGKKPCVPALFTDEAVGQHAAPAPSIWQKIRGWVTRASFQLTGKIGLHLSPVTSNSKKPPQKAGLLSPPQPLVQVREIDREVAKLPLTPPTVITPTQPSLVVYFFGRFRVYQDDQILSDWPSQKSLAVLKYVLVQRPDPVNKDILMDTFWSDAEGETARRNLHQAIYALRQTLKHGRAEFPYVQFENDCYFLNPEAQIWLDFDEFETHYRRGKALLDRENQSAAALEFGIAEELYTGDFLAEDLYEDWPAARREHYRTLYLDLLVQLSAFHIRQSQYSSAILYCRKILNIDNCAEQAYRNLIQCYIAQGQRHLAMREYQSCVQCLKQELNLAPSAETRALYQELLNS